MDTVRATSVACQTVSLKGLHGVRIIRSTLMPPKNHQNDRAFLSWVAIASNFFSKVNRSRRKLVKFDGRNTMLPDCIDDRSTPLRADWCEQQSPISQWWQPAEQQMMCIAEYA
jgi:hypothetical protein